MMQVFAIVKTTGKDFSSYFLFKDKILADNTVDKLIFCNYFLLL